MIVTSKKQRNWCKRIANHSTRNWVASCKSFNSSRPTATPLNVRRRWDQIKHILLIKMINRPRCKPQRSVWRPNRNIKKQRIFSTISGKLLKRVYHKRKRTWDARPLLCWLPRFKLITIPKTLNKQDNNRLKDSKLCALMQKAIKYLIPAVWVSWQCLGKQKK